MRIQHKKILTSEKASVSMRLPISEGTTGFSHVLSCHSVIPMLKQWPQYGIPILVTDERASQVSHCSCGTKASHNKSRLIPEPRAPPRKTKHSALTKTSYYSRVPHVATLSIKLVWLRRRSCLLSLKLRKSKVFSLSVCLPTAEALLRSLSYFLITSTCSLFSGYTLVFHLHAQGMEW